MMGLSSVSGSVRFLEALSPKKQTPQVNFFLLFNYFIQVKWGYCSGKKHTTLPVPDELIS